MSKPKFASLTAGLLARKGEALPTAQPFASLVPALSPEPVALRPAKGGGLAGLIQRASSPAAPRVAVSEPPRVTPEPQGNMPDAAPVSPAPARLRIFRLAAPGTATASEAPPPESAPIRRHGVTVRLDGPRYRRLMVVSGRYGRTYQDILARALDVYMTALGIEDPAERHGVPPRKRQ